MLQPRGRETNLADEHRLSTKWMDGWMDGWGRFQRVLDVPSGFWACLEPTGLVGQCPTKAPKLQPIW